MNEFKFKGNFTGTPYISWGKQKWVQPIQGRKPGTSSQIPYKNNISQLG